MKSRISSLLVLVLSLAVAACATGGSSASVSASPPSSTGSSIAGARTETASDGARELACTDCDAIPMPVEITRAIETRIGALKELGGDCSRYGTVLESSYKSGRITIRPFMWRVGRELASGEAKPNGDMTLAREIDSLNVGVRTVEDVLHSMEHEAVHITFELPSGVEATEDKANQIVRSCRG